MRRILSIILCISFILVGCSKSTETTDESFTAFTDQLFIKTMSEDTLARNYTLSHPENYGIIKGNSTLGTVTIDGLKASLAENENLLEHLHTFHNHKLPLDQQILYNTLELSYLHARKESNYLYHHQYLGPTTGVQAQLPVLLAEFHLASKSDIEDYFALLKSIPMYLQSITDYEKEKAAHHTALAASTLSRIIEQCKTFVKTPEKNVLITCFHEHINETTFLDSTEKKTYIAKNKILVLNTVLEAYKKLILDLEDLLSEARPDGGLSSVKNGKEYYTYLFESSVGSLRTIADAKNLLQRTISKTRTSLINLAAKNPELFKKASIIGATTNTPREILMNLETSTRSHFPAIKSVKYRVKYVPDTLEDFLSPAFYLTPPIDDATQNIIYINGATRFENTDLFPTLAHEGYPGHLLQAAYLQEHLVSPLQSTFNFGGYSEGWATYAEIYSYRYTGAPADIVKILQNNTILSLCLYARCDIGIHYDGWGIEKTGKYLEKYGISDAEQVLAIYQNILDEPASYPKYTMGYLEILECKKQAMALQKDAYSDKSFHTWFLSMGPTWYEVLKAFMKPWFGGN